MSGTETRLKKWLPHKDIVKNGVLYLRRHYLSPRKWRLPRWFLHLIKRPDVDRHPHDHPWGFLTLVLKGGYTEEVYHQGKFLYRREVRAGNLLWRPAEHTHKITHLHVPEVWTLVVAAPARRTWGFWTEEGEFVPWMKYREAEDGVSEVWPEDEVSN